MAKIVGNIFGPNQDQVVQSLGGNLGGQAGGLIQRLLPILAPIVLAYLSKRISVSAKGLARTTRSVPSLEAVQSGRAIH
jgi:hypothetical protein